MFHKNSCRWLPMLFLLLLTACGASSPPVQRATPTSNPMINIQQSSQIDAPFPTPTFDQSGNFTGIAFPEIDVKGTCDFHFPVSPITVNPNVVTMAVPQRKLIVIKREVSVMLQPNGGPASVDFYTLIIGIKKQPIYGGDEYLFVPKDQVGITLAAFITEGFKPDCTPPAAGRLRFDDSIVFLAQTYPLPASMRACEFSC